MAGIPRAEDQPTLTIWPEVGQALGLSRPAAYAGAKRGEIPVIKVGRRLLVPTAALHRMLQLDEPRHADAP